MRVELIDINGSSRSIVTNNAELVAEWIKEWLPLIQKDYLNYHYEWRIRLWPDSPEEAEYIKAAHYNDLWPMRKDTYEKLASLFYEMAYGEKLTKHSG